MSKQTKELIIIGGGAAGITAGIYAARKYIETTLITKDFTGQIGVSTQIENYPGFEKISGLNLIQNFEKHLKTLDIEIKTFEGAESVEKNNSGFKVITDENNYQDKALIIATGSIPKKLGIKNEDKFLGHGISYCLTCDETAFEGKIVAVIGGGNAGAEAALELSRFCSKVYLLEYFDFLSADKILQVEITKIKKIEVVTSVDIKSFAGNAHLEKIIYQDRKSKQQKEIRLAGCFIEIGALPNTKFVKNFLDLNKKEEIKVNPLTLETSIKGIFEAGDATDLPGKQIIIACGQGALAALSVYKYLTNY